MSDDGPSFFGRFFSALRNLVILSLVVASAAAAVWSLSNLNARTWALEARDGKLVVMKGRMMPTGFEPWAPTDPSLSDAYAPLDLKGNSRGDVTQVKYEDRDSLDRALFSVIETIAKPRVASDVPADLEEGLAFVRRAEKLHGLSDDQRVSLKRMQGDVAFYLARTNLIDSQRQVDEALAQLKLAATFENRHTREANQMLMAVEPGAKGLSDALRLAVHGLSAPATPPKPEVAPTPKPPEPVAPTETSPKPDVPPTVVP